MSLRTARRERGGVNCAAELVAEGQPGHAFFQTAEAGPRFIALLAFSFVHCKNTRLEPETVSPALAKRRHERGRAPITRYYTLNIAPMRRVLEAARAEHGVSLQQALHICRGHFKDFRQGAGLFGKQRGLYWWDMHTRGTARAGEIRKDYAVALPGSAPARRGP